jgi:hypothetical protein
MHAIATQSEQGERLQQRGMDFVADDHADRRRMEEAVPLDVPSGAREDGVPRSRQPREVRGRRAGDESAAAAVGQSKNLSDPAQDDVLDGRDRG